MSNSDDKRKHLEFLQNIVLRLAQTSSLVKGWSVTISAALLALANKETDWRYCLIPLVPITAFWVLDGYFLNQERMFRSLFDEVASDKVEQFKMSVKEKNGTTGFTWAGATFSDTLVIFHGILATTILVVALLIASKS